MLSNIQSRHNRRLNKRDMLNRKTEKPKGVLHHKRNEPFIGVERFYPSPELQEFVEHYWTVRWERQPRVVRETVPHPSVHLVFEPGDSKLHGVHLRRFSRVIEGDGRVLGVKFWPGGFRAFMKNPVRSLTGKIVHPTAIFGTDVLDAENQAVGLADAPSAFEVIERFLIAYQPVANNELRLVTEMNKQIACNRSITQVSMLVDQFGIGLRTLQRLFSEYVGVSPKWVIQRQRLIETADQIRDRNEEIDFALLAAELGFADQAHMIREFKKMVGQPPASYRKSLE